MNKQLLNPKSNMKKFVLLLFFIGGLVSVQAQQLSNNSPNKSDNALILKLGVNLVDSTGDANPFSFFNDFEQQAFSNNPKVELEYRFSKWLSVSGAWSSNKWKANKGNIDENIVSKDIDYSALDLDIKLYYSEAFDWFDENDWLELYLHGGAGSVSQATYSSTSINLGSGTNVWFSDNFGINLNITGKFVSSKENELYNTNHFQYSASLMYRFTKNKKDNNIDFDGDGVQNYVDDCPNTFGVVRNNGCPEELLPEEQLLDSDGDGVSDAVDNCPTVFGTNNGCPDVIKRSTQNDLDGDGVLDAVDKCPETIGSVTNDGCPLMDTDNDGILDIADKCPNIKGLPTYNGCPLPDTDNDGVFDIADRCPQVPGIISNEGCPYKEVIIGEVHEELTQLTSRILFETSSYNMSVESYSVLLQITLIMKQHPEAVFKLEGHTDNVGSKEFNSILSKQRVTAVRDYFVNNLGISASSIVIEYYGETKPKVSNSTKEGRRINRRVELMRIK